MIFRDIKKRHQKEWK